MSDNKDSRISQFTELIKKSTDYDPSFFFIGRDFDEVIEEMRSMFFPSLNFTRSFDELYQDISTNKSLVCQSIQKIDKESQKQLLELIVNK